MSFNLDGLSFGGSSGGSDKKKKPAPFSFGGAAAAGPAPAPVPAASSGGGGGGFSFGSPAPSAAGTSATSASASGGAGFSFGGGGGGGGNKKPPPFGAAASAPAAAKQTASSPSAAFPPMSKAAPKNPFGPPAPAAAAASTTAPIPKRSAAVAPSASAAAGFPPMSKAAPKPFGGSGSGSGSAKKPATGSGSGFSFGGGSAAATATTSAPVTTPPPPSLALSSAKKSPAPGGGGGISVSFGSSSAGFGPTSASTIGAATSTKTTRAPSTPGISFNEGALVPVPGPGAARTPPTSTALTAYAADVETRFPPEALGRLACLGPDGRSLHSVAASAGAGSSSTTSSSSRGGGSTTEYTIVTRFLPLEEAGTAYSYGGGDEASGVGGSSSPTKKRKVDTVRTALPEELVASLAVDAPLGLICVDNDSSSSGAGGRHNSNASGGGRGRGGGGRLSFGADSDHNDDDGNGADGAKADASLPLLCLYTARSAFVLDISYSAETSSAGEAEGTAQSSVEPFEQHLLSAASSTKIVTILPGPGCGYQSTLSSWDVICRPGSMMALMSSDGEDSLVLSHGIGGKGGGSTPQPVTVPLRRGYEELGSDISDSIADVCFVSSSPAAATDDTATSTDLFPTISVLLLSRTGCIHAASPILFDGALYPRKAVIDASRHLHGEIERLDNNNPAKTEEAMLWRRAKAAAHYLDEVFGALTDRSMYVKANALPSARDGPQSSKEWPVATQGPLVVVPEVSDVPTPMSDGAGSSCIVPFSGTGAGSACVSGFAVGRVVNTDDGANNPRVDVGVMSAGTTILPRFDFESEADADALDENLEGVAAIVEIVEFESPPSTQELDGPGVPKATSALRCTLIPDPIDGSALHHVTQRGIVTVTTNAVDVIGQKVASTSASSGREPAPEESISTSAWSLLEVSSPASLEGVGLSGDAHLGHVLLATASDGSIEGVNITAAQYLHEASKISSENVSERALTVVSSAQTESDEALKAMESVLPLHELIAPLLRDISSGLAGMGKIVGGATRPQDANPGTVATVLDTKTSCEKNVVLPLKELHSLTTARREVLQDMYESQMTQIEELRNMVETLRERMAKSNEKKEQAEENATALAQRSAAVLTAARDLVPTITEAEHQYFTQLKRYDASCKKWQGHIDTMKNRAEKLSDETSAQSAPPALDIDANNMTHLNELVKGQGNHLKLAARKLEKLGRETKRITQAVGLDDAHGAGVMKGKENVHGQ